MNSSKEITVVEILHAVKGKTYELRKALLKLVPICKKEPGCLLYELFEPIDGEGQFLILMRWKDKKFLKDHEASLVIQEFVQSHDKIIYDEVHQTEWVAVSQGN
ncbi:MAG: hypothetical protein COT85_01505 [Chlamydiae bacterium CG10_big_fil_rev_8_21_14_0_10_42_34]|nr:MAG: hypothetical protein COT85_01505 [Chlamydiae bacterium CG10_big_fil_rev_8_21_14_0_10_42_34]